MKYFVVILILFLLSAISFYIIDNVFFKGVYGNELCYSKEPRYKVPKGYKIISDGKYYGIKQEKKHGDYFLIKWRSTTTFSTIGEGDNLVLFKTEDRAKGALKYYIEKEKEEKNRYSNFK
jgi:hypothetical protein